GDCGDAEEDVHEEKTAKGSDDADDHVEEVVSFETEGAALAVVDTVRIGDAQLVHGFAGPALELRSEHPVGHAEDVEERAHDGGGTGDDYAGDNAHFAVRIAALHLVRSGSDVDDAPDKPDHE